ncbi:hypothetical protein E3M87_000995 [Escherichia coli]|nr:hypothetical protein [Escherichia coli]
MNIVDQQTFRDAMSCMGAAVNIITTDGPAGRAGFTASAVCSVTTYAENIGVMAVTKVYSTLVFVAAAVIAMLLGFSPKFGALIHTIPAPVIGGASIVVFGLIAVAGARIWVQNRVDLSQNGNLIMVAVTLVLGAGDFALTLGGFTLGGIGTATFGAILLNALLSRRLVDVPPPEVVHQEP